MSTVTHCRKLGFFTGSATSSRPPSAARLVLRPFDPGDTWLVHGDAGSMTAWEAPGSGQLGEHTVVLGHPGSGSRRPGGHGRDPPGCLYRLGPPGGVGVADGSHPVRRT